MWTYRLLLLLSRISIMQTVCVCIRSNYKEVSLTKHCLCISRSHSNKRCDSEMHILMLHLSVFTVVLSTSSLLCPQTTNWPDEYNLNPEKLREYRNCYTKRLTHGWHQGRYSIPRAAFTAHVPDVGQTGDPIRPRQQLVSVVAAVRVDHLVRVGDEAYPETQK